MKTKSTLLRKRQQNIKEFYLKEQVIKIEKKIIDMAKKKTIISKLIMQYKKNEF